MKVLTAMFLLSLLSGCATGPGSFGAKVNAAFDRAAQAVCSDAAKQCTGEADAYNARAAVNTAEGDLAKATAELRKAQQEVAK